MANKERETEVSPGATGNDRICSSNSKAVHLQEFADAHGQPKKTIMSAANVVLQQASCPLWTTQVTLDASSLNLQRQVKLLGQALAIGKTLASRVSQSMHTVSTSRT